MGKSLSNNVINIKNRTSIVESTCLIFSTWLPIKYLFLHFLLCRNFLGEIVQSHQKINGPSLREKKYIAALTQVGIVSDFLSVQEP